jgi:hypothetical protein
MECMSKIIEHSTKINVVDNHQQNANASEEVDKFNPLFFPHTDHHALLQMQIPFHLSYEQIPEFLTETQQVPQS